MPNGNADPVADVRTALRFPEAVGLAAPILPRSVDELRRRLAGVRLRGGAYGQVAFSEGAADLLARLHAGETVAAGTIH